MANFYKAPMKATFALAMEEARQRTSVAGALAVMEGWADVELVDKRRRVDTEMERRMMELVGQGWKTHAIARELGVSTPTVNNTVRRLRRGRVAEKTQRA